MNFTEKDIKELEQPDLEAKVLILEEAIVNLMANQIELQNTLEILINLIKTRQLSI